MAIVVLSTFGSLGDLHPKIALGLELKKRGHRVRFASMDYYREKLESLGFDFYAMAPHMDPSDVAEIPEMVDAKTGTEKILKGIIMPSIPEMFNDLIVAVEGADLFVTGEIVYAAKSVVEKTGIRWISTTLAPISLFSAYDPPVPPPAPWMESLRDLPAIFHQGVHALMRWITRDWLEPYRRFRQDLGLDPDHDPIFDGKYSDLLHLVMFSRVLAKPQPDWPKTSLQTGFCFYDGQNDTGIMPDGLAEFLDSGEPPIVFTLGSAAVMAAGDFFDESAKAAKILGRRALLLYGRDNQPPKGLDENIVGFEYAPFSFVFPKAACVVHQAGVGTTGQVLRAGVPQLIMPFGHDQPDNAARCRRLGVGEIISRETYNAERAANMLKSLLSKRSYAEKAAEAGKIVREEHGTRMACDAIEAALIGKNVRQKTFV
jgi:rhamnosyltransferase subunit B